jgi:hypothetical protein
MTRAEQRALSEEAKAWIGVGGVISEIPVATHDQARTVVRPCAVILVRDGRAAYVATHQTDFFLPGEVWVPQGCEGREAHPHRWVVEDVDRVYWTAHMPDESPRCEVLLDALASLSDQPHLFRLWCLNRRGESLPNDLLVAARCEWADLAVNDQETLIDLQPLVNSE